VEFKAVTLVNRLVFGDRQTQAKRQTPTLLRFPDPSHDRTKSQNCLIKSDLSLEIPGYEEDSYALIC
jgi:hypothetical protein